MDWSRRSYYRKQRMLRNYTAALATFSLSIFFVPIVGSFKRNTKIPMYMVGALFWIALILTVTLAARINNSRRRSSAFNIKFEGLRKLGLIHFFQNGKALIADAVMFLSLLAFIFARFLTWNTIICFLIISIFSFSFGMHCMLNGINYIYIKQKLGENSYV